MNVRPQTVIVALILLVGATIGPALGQTEITVRGADAIRIEKNEHSLDLRRLTENILTRIVSQHANTVRGAGLQPLPHPLVNALQQFQQRFVLQSVDTNRKEQLTPVVADLVLLQLNNPRIVLHAANTGRSIELRYPRGMFRDRSPTQTRQVSGESASTIPAATNTVGVPAVMTAEPSPELTRSKARVSPTVVTAIAKPLAATFEATDTPSLTSEQSPQDNGVRKEATKTNNDSAEPEIIAAWIGAVATILAAIIGAYTVLRSRAREP